MLLCKSVLPRVVIGAIRVRGGAGSCVKVLAISDRVVPQIYDGEAILRGFGDVELVLSCGDLPFHYLEFIVSMLNVPLYYVLGNHCPPVGEDSWGLVSQSPLDGAVNLDNRVVRERGLILAGLQGSMRYNSRPYHQYTEAQMSCKVLKLIPSLLYHRIRYGRYLDVLVTHAPPYGIHDGPDLAHRGFRIFRWFMRCFRPRYLIHGHKHVYDAREARETRYHDTWVVNAYGFKRLEIPPFHPQE